MDGWMDGWRWRGRTFLSFVELWRARMVHAWFVSVGKYFAAALVDAFLRHGRWRGVGLRTEV